MPDADGPKVRDVAEIPDGIDDEILRVVREVSNNQIERVVQELTNEFAAAAEQARRAEEEAHEAA
jgi:hypothetical protein